MYTVIMRLFYDSTKILDAHYAYAQNVDTRLTWFVSLGTRLCHTLTFLPERCDSVEHSSLLFIVGHLSTYREGWQQVNGVPTVMV